MQGRKLARPDPHSFRDDAQPTVEHLSWTARADFGTRTLDAVAELQLRSGGAGRRAPRPARPGHSRPRSSPR